MQHFPERTRDKLSAARKKGKWIGCHPVLGYDIDPKGGRIVVNADEAQHVRAMYNLYLKLGTLNAVWEPATASAYSLNMTVVPSGFLGYLSVWPAGGSQPEVSTLNAYKRQAVANAALVPAGASGAVRVYVTNTTHVIIDTNGYFGQ